MAGSAWTNQAQNLIIVQSGGNFQGLFVYSPTPGTGNLIASIAAASGTDPYTNSYLAGIVAYGTITDRFAAVLEVSNNNLGLSITDLTSAPFLPPSFSSGQAGASGTSALMYSGASTVSAVGAQVSVLDSVFGATTKGLIELFGGKVLLGNGSTAVVDDNNNVVTLGQNAFVTFSGATSQQNFAAAGQGPFITGESFHTLSNPAGFTGFCRVKLVPWNGIWYDMEGSTNAAGTFTFGSPPSSAYNPTTARHWDIGGANVNGRMFVPTSGGPQVITGAANVVGLSVIVPSN